CSLLFNGSPTSAPSLGDLLIRVTARAALEIVQPIPGKNQMRVRINKTAENDFPASIDNFRIACFLFYLSAGTDDVDLAVANQHSTIGNHCQFGQFTSRAWPLRAGQGDQLGCAKNRDRTHDSLNR